MSQLAVQMAAERRLVDARRNPGWKQHFSFAQDLNAGGRSGKTQGADADGALHLSKGLHLGANLFLGTDSLARTKE